MKRRLLLILLVVTVAAPAVADDKTVYALISKRLAWMQSVAAWKMANNKRVEDLERETVVLAAAAATASARGLSSDSVNNFFQAQIDAAKEIQNCWIARWKAGEMPLSTIPDLATDIRPELTRLGSEIINAIAQEQFNVELADRKTFEAVVRVDCLGNKARDALFDELAKIRASSN
jgi:chorismate mutase-like protein